MTHESFKDIVSNYEAVTLDFINKFLDGDVEDFLLSKWFEIWKTGDFRKIFDDIEKFNDFYFQSKLQSRPLRAPIDAAMTRKKENKNVRN